MGRPKKEAGEILVEVPCKVPQEVANEIARLSIETDRSRSQVARKLLLRGLAAYKRDEKLDEPAETEEKKPRVTKSRRPAQQRDSIDEILADAHYSDGKPLSKADRELMRKLIEEDRARREKKEEE